MGVTMKRLCKSCDKSVFELFDDIIIQILHRLPSKSLARFICVCKKWHKYIADPSLVYSCRLQRWSPQPHMIGFFCQGRDEGHEQIRFFFSSRKSSEVMIDGSLDESVNLLGRGIYIIASSNGFILIAEDLKYQRVYHVYNPATRQRFSVPVIRTSSIRIAVIGFHCKVDDPEKDLISFTIVRFEAECYPISSVTIESFSSDTNVWTTVNLTLDEPLQVWHSYWNNIASAGVIDGVFCWIDDDKQIILYDSDNRRFWALQLTQEMNAVETWWSGFGVSSGDLYYALYDEAEITVWCLESNIRNQDAVWVRKCATNVTDAVVKFCPEGSEAEVKIVDIHPANPHMFFLDINGRIISYDLEKKIAEFLYDAGKGDYLYFTYEWHQWPRLLRQTTSGSLISN